MMATFSSVNLHLWFVSCLLIPVSLTFPQKSGKMSNLLLEVCQSSCKNGQCVTKISENAHEHNIMCQCFEGYDGESCDTYKCTPSCKQGTCVSQDGRRSCQCKPGFSGADCNNVNWNTILGISAKPKVDPGAIAQLVELKVNQRSPQCAQNFVCQNGGYCRVFQMGVRCECPFPYTGAFCQQKCDKRCQNGGRCYMNNGTPVCNCPWSFRGEFCETIST